MNVFLWCPAALIVFLIAVDELRDRARQRREDREWSEIRQMLEADPW